MNFKKTPGKLRRSSPQVYQEIRKREIREKSGQPGGRDDPLRRGLNGSGVRKYLRLFNQGLTSEGARKQVFQEKKEGERHTSQQNTEDNTGRENQSEKRRGAYYTSLAARTQKI